VLRGARGLLETGRIRAVFFEASGLQLARHGSSVAELFNLLHGAGFALFRTETSPVCKAAYGRPAPACDEQEMTVLDLRLAASCHYYLLSGDYLARFTGAPRRFTVDSWCDCWSDAPDLTRAHCCEDAVEDPACWGGYFQFETCCEARWKEGGGATVYVNSEEEERETLATLQ